MYLFIPFRNDDTRVTYSLSYNCIDQSRKLRVENYWHYLILCCTKKIESP